MNTTTHARSRKAALFGLIVQLIAAMTAVTMAQTMKSLGMSAVFWMLLGGIPIWLALLLLFRQRELTALEALDLEELRRERETKGGEALFGEESGGVYGFRVAQARLEWMERFLVPGFSLFTAIFLISGGAWMFQNSQRLMKLRLENPLPDTEFVEIGLVILSVLTLLLFFCSRYATGMARVREWQALRGGGSFMFGNTLAALAMVVAFGINLYQGIEQVEDYTALTIFAVMVVLGIETIFNFVLDIYRPKTPGTEPRAAFDSRLLGLISEPGGIARNVAEAVNYQFGFQVSQTWFYQLMQRTLLPLAVAGGVTVWALSCIVIVYPHEHAIVVRLGQQLNAENPLGPGIHFKLPAPIDIAEKYPTGQIQQFSVGYKVGDQPIATPRGPGEEGRIEIEQWTDAKHSGREHFNFVVMPTPRSTDSAAPTSAPASAAVGDVADGSAKRTPVHLIRLEAFVQYRIRADKLVDYTGHTDKPEAILRNVAWEEVTRLAAGTHVDDLMGPARQKLGDSLKAILTRRADGLKLGIEIVQVGLLNVHPEKSVAQAFRGVVTAQQERVAEIRKARVEEERVLSAVAGNKTKAVALSKAIEHMHDAEVRKASADQSLGDASKVSPALAAKIDALAAQYLAKLEADWNLERTAEANSRAHEEFDIGMGGTVADVRSSDKSLDEARARQKSASEALDAALRPVRDELTQQLGADRATTYLSAASARFAVEFWTRDMEKSLTGLEGEAAVKLAQANATRYQLEMRAAGELARVQNERYAYAANPPVYRARRYLQAMVTGMKSARKYFLAFDPGDRKIQVWLDAQEQARPDMTNVSTDVRE